MSESRPEPEAARWRRKLRETEAERDALAARVEQLQHHYVETLLDRHNLTTEAVFAAGMTLPDLLDGDGNPDPQKVTAAATTARDLLGVTPGLYVPAEGRLPKPPTNGSFSAAFTPKDKP